MNHSYEKSYSDRKGYLIKKRLIESKHIYDKEQHDDGEKLNNTRKYNNISNFHSRPFKSNFYYNQSYKYNKFYNNSKNNYINRYSNERLKKDHKKSMNINSIKGVRNISNCEIHSPQSMSLNENIEENSLRSISDSTNISSPYKLDNQFNNSKGTIKIVSNMDRNGHYTHSKIMEENQENNINRKDYAHSPNLNNKEKGKIEGSNSITSKSKGKKEINEKSELPNVFKKIAKYECFNRNSIKISKNPLENIVIYPESVLDFNRNVTLKNSYCTKNDNTIFNLSMDSCYLLAKIPNWRLVSRFVPISSLKSEKFEKIPKYDEEESRTKSVEKSDEKKTHLVYSEKCEDFVEDYLEKNRNKKKEIKKDILDMKSIISQYQYDAQSIKNKIKQNKYNINFLNIKSGELEKVIDGK